MKKFALLGADQDALELAAAAVEQFDLLLTSVVEAGDRLDEARQLAPSVKALHEWESLIHGAVADMVIVGAAPQSADRAEQLRKLVQAGIPVVAVHPACEAIIGFELEMIQHDVGGVLFPYHPARWHGAFLRFTEISASEPRIEQFVFERSMADRSADRVARQLERDLDLMRVLLGSLSKVAAMGNAAQEDEGASLANLTATLTGQNNVVGRWSVVPGEKGQTGGQLSLWAERGKSRLEMPDGESRWKVVSPETEEEFDGSPAASAMAEFLRQVESLTAAESAEGAHRAEWTGASRALEAADAARRSLKRGKTIDIYNEEHSEEETFKGVMAAGGCGILLLAFFILLALATIDGVTSAPTRQPDLSSTDSAQPLELNGEAPDRQPQRRSLWIRLWPAYPLLIFLLLQFLRIVARERSAAKQGASESATTSQET